MDRTVIVEAADRRFFGTGTTMASLKHAGTWQALSDQLKICAITELSWSQHCRNSRGEILSGPGDILMLRRASSRITSASPMEN